MIYTPFIFGRILSYGSIICRNYATYHCVRSVHFSVHWIGPHGCSGKSASLLVVLKSVLYYLDDFLCKIVCKIIFHSWQPTLISRFQNISAFVFDNAGRGRTAMSGCAVCDLDSLLARPWFLHSDNRSPNPPVGSVVSLWILAIYTSTLNYHFSQILVVEDIFKVSFTAVFPIMLRNAHYVI